jgi:hypothetical protein
VNEISIRPVAENEMVRRSKGILQDLDSSAEHACGVEPHAGYPQTGEHAVPRLEQILRGTADPHLFLGRDRLEWITEVVRASRLHLNDGEHSATKRHYIELASFGAKVPGDDLPTTLSVMSGDEVFAPSPTSLS